MLLGRDSNADLLLSAMLGSAGVDTSHVMRAYVPTGCAYPASRPTEENSIVVFSWSQLSLMDIPAADALRDTWLGAGVLVLALEIPLRVCSTLLRWSRNTGVRLLPNAAPARTLSPATLRHCDPPGGQRDGALREVLGNSAIAPDAPFEVLAQALLLAGARSVVITLGVDGSLITDGGPVVHVPAYRVDAVDTTGAGDAFVGAVAAELARGVALEDAVRFATAVSAVSVQKLGAQSSYVDRAHVESFIASHR